MSNLSSETGPNKNNITNVINSYSSFSKTTYIILRGKSGMKILNGVLSPRYAVVSLKLHI
jgi:hypothetical protein